MEDTVASGLAPSAADGRPYRVPSFPADNYCAMGLPGVFIAVFAGAGIWAGMRQLGWPPPLAATLGIMAAMLLALGLSFAAYQ